MALSLTNDPQAHLYDDLLNGDGEKAARELLLLVKKFVCTCNKCSDLASSSDDIALEVFERVCEKIHTFRGESKFLTWVCAIARYVILERLRNAKKDRVLEELLDDLVDEHSNPEQQLIEQTTHEINLILVDEALTTLTERQRDVFTYKHTTDLTSAEIGEKLSISAGAVRSALADASKCIGHWRKEKGYLT